jgi:hypothetical protein
MGYGFVMDPMLTLEIAMTARYQASSSSSSEIISVLKVLIAVQMA